MILGLMVSPLSTVHATRALASAFLRYAPADVDVRELLVSDVPTQPPYSDQLFPQAGSLWKQKVSMVDGLLILVGANRRSIPGNLKLALDWASQPDHVNVLRQVPCVVAAVGEAVRPSFLALQHARTVLDDAGATVMQKPDLSLVVMDDTFTNDERVDDPEVADIIVGIIEASLGFVAHERRARIAEAETPSVEFPIPLVAGPAVRRPGPIL